MQKCKNAICKNAKMQYAKIAKYANADIIFFNFSKDFFWTRNSMSLISSCFTNSASILLIIIGFLSTGFIFLTKHHLKHLIKLFSFLGNRKDELPSQALISEITRCRQKEHCAVYQVANQ